MSATTVKKAISFAVWGLGILGSLFGCFAYLRAAFVIGDNDSPVEIWGLTFALATPLPACVLALWRRVISSVWLVFAGIFYVYGVFVQRTYMIHVRNFPDQPSLLKTFEYSLVIAGPLLLLGSFGIVTNRLNWPLLWRRDGDSTSLDQNA